VISHSATAHTPWPSGTKTLIACDQAPSAARVAYAAIRHARRSFITPSIAHADAVAKKIIIA
jgi:hypothetical protein